MPARHAALRSRGQAGHPGHLSAGILLIAVLGVLALTLTGGTLIAAAELMIAAIFTIRTITASTP